MTQFLLDYKEVMRLLETIKEVPLTVTSSPFPEHIETVVGGYEPAQNKIFTFLFSKNVNSSGKESLKAVHRMSVNDVNSFSHNMQYWNTDQEDGSFYDGQYGLDESELRKAVKDLSVKDEIEEVMSVSSEISKYLTQNLAEIKSEDEEMEEPNENEEIESVTEDFDTPVSNIEESIHDLSECNAGDLVEFVEGGLTVVGVEEDEVVFLGGLRGKISEINGYVKTITPGDKTNKLLEERANIAKLREYIKELGLTSDQVLEAIGDDEVPVLSE
jgi:hypothetical protein